VGDEEEKLVSRGGVRVASPPAWARKAA
jgi:hypothetical protein